MYISDGKTHLSYSLLCWSALSNEEGKNIVRKFKSNQRKERSTINTMATTCN